MVDGIELDDYSKKAGYDENGIEKKWLTKGRIAPKISYFVDTIWIKTRCFPNYFVKRSY